MEEESKLSAVNKETYDSIFLLLDTNLLGAVELFIPGHDAKCIVHADLWLSHIAAVSRSNESADIFTPSEIYRCR